MKLLRGFVILVMAVICIALIYFVFFAIDDICFDSKIYNSLKYDSDCDYTPPTGSKVVYCSDINRWAVASTEYNDYYLYTREFGRIDNTFSHNRMPSTFADSCLAKGYLKAFVKQNEPKIKCAQ